MYKKDLSYRNIPFSCETPDDDFFFYGAVDNLYTKCERNKNVIIRIRTVGILENNHGRFSIREMATTHNTSIAPDPRQSIQVSVAHMNKLITCSRMPYPVQLFGRLQWHKRPVIFAQIVQPLSASIATLLYETISRVSTLQSVNHSANCHQLD